MKTAMEGFKLIKSFEGFRDKAYVCPAGIWTIGYGHTRDVYLGQVVSRYEAEEYLKEDVSDAECVINKYVHTEINQHQFDALVSFVFNVGRDHFLRSTLLKLLNAGDYIGTVAQFLRWNKVGNKILPGLTRRRLAEKSLFETPMPMLENENVVK